MHLTSTRNPLVMSVAKLHQPRHRRTQRLTIVEGPHQVADAVRHGAVVRHLFVHEDDPWTFPADITLGDRVPEIIEVNDAVLSRLAGTDHPRGPLAVMDEPEAGVLSAVDTVVLHDIADPGNVGAIARTAVAFGWRLAVTAGCADPWSPKVVRASASVLFAAPPIRLGSDPLDQLAAAGLAPVATVAAGGSSPESLERTGPVALLIGNEAHGLPDEAIERSLPVTIPLAEGVESLNAAAAAAVAMYALRP